MSLELYFHPLSSFSQKVLIAFYENETDFEPHILDLADPEASARFKQIWPIGKFPVLSDRTKGRLVPESSVIIEYVEQQYPVKTRLIPEDRDLALQTRLRDRFYDLYVNVPMQKIVTDRLRPAGQNDLPGVEAAKAQIEIAYGVIDEQMKSSRWATGDAFTLADCAAAPPLFYADMMVPLGDRYRNVSRYLARLTERASFARALAEAKPYLAMIPK